MTVDQCYHLTLGRESRLDAPATLGKLTLGETTLHTIERPWVNNTPFESCIPEGTYDLVPFVRPGSGMLTYAIVNPVNDVYLNKADIPAGQTGRYLILFHPGNTIDDVVGCIAPGCVVDRDRFFVGQSRAAFEQLMDLLDFKEGHTLDITRID